MWQRGKLLVLQSTLCLAASMSRGAVLNEEELVDLSLLHEASGVPTDE